MDVGTAHLHVVPSLDRGWVVRESADGPAVRRTLTRRGALDFALNMARKHGGEVSTHAVDGTVTAHVEVRALGKRPWWYRRSAPSLVSQVLLMVVAIADLVDPSSGLPRWIPVLMLVLGCFFVCSFIGSWWLDRREGPIVRRVVPQASPTVDPRS